MHRWLKWIVLLATLLRLPMLLVPMWYDELFTVTMARLPMNEWWQVLQSDTHPPLAYLPNWVVGRILGTSDIAMRLPMLIFGVASVGLIYALTKALGKSEKTSIMASLLLAIFPSHLFYSTEARAYILFVCVVWGAMWTILKDKPLGLMLIGLLPLIHTHGYIYAGILFVWVAWTKPKWFRQAWLWWAIGILLSVCWLPFTLQQSLIVANRFWLPPFGFGSILRFLLDLSISLDLDTAGTLVVLILAVWIMGWAFWRQRVWVYKPEGRLWLLVTFGIPVMTAILSVVWHNIFLLRYLLPSALLILVALAEWLVQQRGIRTVVIPLLIFGCGVTLLFPNPYRLDYGAVIEPCSQNDAIYVVSPQMAIIAQHFSDLPIYLWRNGDDLNQYLTDDAKTALRFSLVDSVHDVNGVVCVVASDNPLLTDVQREQLALIATDTVGQVLFDYQDLRVTLYHVNPKSP